MVPQTSGLVKACKLEPSCLTHTLFCLLCLGAEGLMSSDATEGGVLFTGCPDVSWSRLHTAREMGRLLQRGHRIKAREGLVLDSGLDLSM